MAEQQAAKMAELHVHPRS